MKLRLNLVHLNNLMRFQIHVILINFITFCDNVFHDVKWLARPTSWHKKLIFTRRLITLRLCASEVVSNVSNSLVGRFCVYRHCAAGAEQFKRDDDDDDDDTINT